MNPQRIWIFGHFGSGNFGSEITFQGFLCHIRRLLPNAEVACICARPESVTATYGIKAVPFSKLILKPCNFSNRLVRLLRQVFLGLPCELWRWLQIFNMLKGADALMIPGTGLLTDAWGIQGWGPYNLFKWSLMARLRGCKVLFVSVGAGPIHSVFGRCLVRAAISLAHFRSYRDYASMKYLKDISFRADVDRVYPDLVFSVPVSIPRADERRTGRLVVGLGLMEHTSMYGVSGPDDATYRTYLESLVAFARWLLAREYDIRLVIGDSCDDTAVREFKALLDLRHGAVEEGRILYEPTSTFQQVISQLAATDMVVVTRFHNVLFAMLLNKLVMSISFHRKCAALMGEMGLSDYCQDIEHLSADKLIEQFVRLEKNADTLRPMMKRKVEWFREDLDDQYNLIRETVLGNGENKRVDTVEDGPEQEVLSGIAHVLRSRALDGSGHSEITLG